MEQKPRRQHCVATAWQRRVRSGRLHRTDGLDRQPCRSQRRQPRLQDDQRHQRFADLDGRVRERRSESAAGRAGERGPRRSARFQPDLRGHRHRPLRLQRQRRELDALRRYAVGQGERSLHSLRRHIGARRHLRARLLGAISEGRGALGKPDRALGAVGPDSALPRGAASDRDGVPAGAGLRAGLRAGRSGSRRRPPEEDAPGQMGASSGHLGGREFQRHRSWRAGKNRHAFRLRENAALFK